MFRDVPTAIGSAPLRTLIETLRSKVATRISTNHLANESRNRQEILLSLALTPRGQSGNHDAMKVFFAISFSMLGLLALQVSCSSRRSDTGLPPPPPPPQVGSHYSIQPGDLLNITFAGEPDLAQQARVDWNGMINVSTLSAEGSTELQAGGLSPTQLASRIGAYAEDNKILVKARAQVLVVEYATLAYSVLGQVGQPGRYNFPRGVQPRLGLEEAVALAGGYTRLARQSRVLLKRGSAVYTIDLKKLASEPGHPPVIIIPGDVITVTERTF
jgi:protein involved in polysaccharide export with SLBB domain